MPKTFDSVKDVPDLSGKVVLVTGGNAGIGSATVHALAAHNPKCLYLCARTLSSAEQVVKSIHAEHPQANVQILPLDLTKFDSIKSCAKEVNKSDRLDLLFLNAGIAATAPGLTKEGYERHFGTNHLGHAYFTQLLMPKLQQTQREDKASDVRIVVVSSMSGHSQAPKDGLVLKDMKQPNGGGISPLYLYGHSKLANILFAKKLSQLYPSITSTSNHPGVVKSEIWGRADGLGSIMSMLLRPVVWWVGISTDEGAKTLLWCATAARGKDGVENGKFYIPIGKLKDDNAHGKDQKLADELWKWTNEELATHGAPGWPEP